MGLSSIPRIPGTGCMVALLQWYLVTSSVTTAFRCYVCSYTLTGDPAVNFECADRPWNFTVGQPIMQCDKSRYCVTKTVYEKGYRGIRSVTRSCGTPETFGCGVNCCQGSFYNEACQYQCQGDLCNSEDEAKRIRTGEPGKKDPVNTSPTYNSLLKSFVTCLSVYIVTLFI